MGALHPDLNRCNFMFSDDRRCRNQIEQPGHPFCVYHRRKLEKDTRKPVFCAAPPRRSAAADTFSQWLSQHSLDTATNIHQAVNQLFVLLAAGRISPREADSLLRLARVMIRSSRDVRNELRITSLRELKPVSEKFLAELNKSLVPAIAADNVAAEAASSTAPAGTAESTVDSSLAPDPAPLEPVLPAQPPLSGEQLAAAIVSVATKHLRPRSPAARPARGKYAAASP